MIFSVVLSLIISSIAAESAAPPWVSSSSVLPTFLALAPNIHDFTRFADGGPDANWYIGYNNAWIVKLPPAPPGQYARAFVGARIGRAKTRPDPAKPWLREVIDGRVYVGLSQAPSFSSEQSYFLAETADIPQEPDPHAHVDGAGASVWFWKEVPLSAVSFSEPNYLAAWSTTKYFVKAASAPILAAASADDSTPFAEPRAWNNRSILGVPPRNPKTSLETPLHNLYPALALKLVPPLPDIEVGVSELAVRSVGRRLLVEFSAWGENVEEAWVEASRDQLDWQRISPLLRRPPFSFSLPADKAASLGPYLRGAARDMAGTLGRSEIATAPAGPADAP